MAVVGATILADIDELVDQAWQARPDHQCGRSCASFARGRRALGVPIRVAPLRALGGGWFRHARGSCVRPLWTLLMVPSVPNLISASVQQIPTQKTRCCLSNSRVQILEDLRYRLMTVMNSPPEPPRQRQPACAGLRFGPSRASFWTVRSGARLARPRAGGCPSPGPALALRPRRGRSRAHCCATARVHRAPAGRCR